MQRTGPSPNTSEAPAAAPPARDRARLLVIVGTALAVVALAEWASSRIVTPEAPAETTTGPQRPANVQFVPKSPAELPPPENKPSVWVIGNSHTYSLPGLKQGEPLRVDSAGILVDELAARYTQAHPNADANFYLLSYPNFLGFEMLTRVGDLLYHGYRPQIVFLGLTWRNIARDTQLRHQVYTAYRDAEFVDAFEAMLNDPKVHASDNILDQIAEQRRRVAHEAEAERMRSDSDHIDQQMTTWAADHLTLMGKSADLRAQIYRVLTERVQTVWDDRTTVKYTYDLVESDYAFNYKCLLATLRLLTSHGAKVVCYYAPERDDLPPLLDPVKQEEFFERFGKDAAELGVTVVDARRVVPNEYWGWVGDSPDRSHFTEPGHQRLSQFLLEAADRAGLTKELDPR